VRTPLSTRFWITRVWWSVPGRCRSTPTRGIDLEATYPWLRTSRHWTKPLPINAYVIEHRDGLVLFDTGQGRASITDPGYFPGGAT
jgi:hypothetical protein